MGRLGADGHLSKRMSDDRPFESDGPFTDVVVIELRAAKTLAEIGAGPSCGQITYA
jgi:hypothetical protein